jgi:mycothiol maleylpyruvate isomerase-like protein
MIPMNLRELSATSVLQDSVRWVGNLDGARAGIVDVAPRFLRMLRSVRRPDAIAIGEWRIDDLAVHMSHVAAGEAMLARSVGSPTPLIPPSPGDIIAAATAFNAAALEGDPERDVSVLADRIEQGIEDFLDAMKGVNGDETLTWLAGVTVPSAALACHLLEELVVHGLDVARSERVPWSIAPEHAALAFGFIIDLLRLSEPETRRAFVNQDAAGGLHASIDLRMRGARRDVFVFEDGLVTIEDPSSRKVDCHISADPVTALLVGMGRMGRVRPALTGRMTAWGRKPWLALRLNSLLKNP